MLADVFLYNRVWCVFDDSTWCLWSRCKYLICTQIVRIKQRSPIINIVNTNYSSHCIICLCMEYTRPWHSYGDRIQDIVDMAILADKIGASVPQARQYAR